MSAKRPNIITILVDDMGFSDLGCFGGEIDTPNLDRLGTSGFRASQFYNTPRCCPSRACLLTGLYPHQAGVGMMVYRDFGDGYQGGMSYRDVNRGSLPIGLQCLCAKRALHRIGRLCLP